jgi:hypothetical protein
MELVVIQPCRTVSTCDAEPLPVIGYSSETPDQLNHIGLGFSGTPPPLNFPFKNPTCFVALDVPVGTPGNQEVANLMAEAQARQCAAAGWTTPEGQPAITYQSAAQSVQETCPDGSQFVFGVIPGLFVDLTQSGADQAALSYCARQVQLHKVCLSAGFSSVCLNQPATLTITASGVSLGKINENLWQITGGEIPPGMTFNGGAIASDSVTITGTPTTPGGYPFTVMVTTPQGDYMEKAFSITVVGVTSMTLPPAQAFTPYSFQLTWEGFSNPEFFVDASSELPPGLSMSASGLISGTPTAMGTFNVLVDIEDATGNCQQQITLMFSGTPVYSITPDLLGDIALFNGGANFPAGTYIVNYVNGAWKAPSLWYLGILSTSEVLYFIYDTVFGGGKQSFPGTATGFTTQALVEAANNGASYTWTHTGGTIGIGQVYGGSPISRSPGSPNPTFSLTRIA